MTIKQSETPDIIDILGAIEAPEKLINSLKKTEVTTPTQTNIVDKKEVCSDNKSILNVAQTKIEENVILAQNSLESTTKSIEKKNKKFTRLLSAGIFGAKYIITSVGIFAVLLLTTNYSAYSNIAKSYIFEDQIALENQSLLNGVNASDIGEKNIEEEEEEEDDEEEDDEEEKKDEKVIKKTKQDRVNTLKKSENESAIKQNQFSIKKLVDKLDKKDINLGIAIVPYENRIVIPKIGKNIPLIEIKETTVDGKKQLDNIFMKELEDGVVRYPGSGLPGTKGNSFIFGHSSNFPWIAGDYNDVFARLGQVEVGDVVYSYYGQKKYKYKIKEKRVISPSDVSILKRDNSKKELTLMTCWPIGTTLNRLILIGEIVEE